MAKDKYTVEEARDRLRNMGMKEDKFGASYINLQETPIGLTGWSLVDFLRSKDVRILIITTKDAEQEKEESFEKIANKRQRVRIKRNNTHCLKYACGF